ncbi:hypothetical protein HAX54_009341 [Datura stramonium]|uniref:Uncharacterized protein n=1 Tax=Datura stramonium TaxID=4076 RepID=A0ABS8TGB6_DATST|nr:hypothetical protein [Datura stramonium]
MDWPMGSVGVNYLSILSCLPKFGRLRPLRIYVISEVNQAAILASFRGSTALIQCLRDEVAGKDAEIAQLCITHQDALILFQEKCAIEKEALKPRSFLCSLNLIKKRLPIQRICKAYDFLKCTLPSSSPPPT